MIEKVGLTNDIRVLVYPTTVSNGRVGAYIGVPPGNGGYMDFDDITCVYGAGKSFPYSDSPAVSLIPFTLHTRLKTWCCFVKVLLDPNVSHFH